MGRKLNSILKSIFITSLATLNVVKSEAKSETLVSDTDNGNTEQIKEKLNNNLSKKLLLKMKNDNSYILASHRSHRSHSSHRSHYSSRSSGTTTPTKSRSTSRPSSSQYIRSTSTTTNSNVTTVKTLKIYKLGDRILKQGMKGKDVTELRNILVAKKYIILKPQEVVIAIDELTFNEVIKNAILKFQKKNELPEDGIVGVLTVHYLKKKDGIN